MNETEFEVTTQKVSDGLEEFEVTTQKHVVNGAKIVVVGVGGGGGNMLKSIAESEIGDKVKMVALNTDAQALEGVQADTKVLIGSDTTKGLGTGMDPEKGKQAALESYEEIKEALKC